jgi:hypothetical protein
MNARFGEQENCLIASVRSDFRMFSVFRGQLRRHGLGLAILLQAISRKDFLRFPFRRLILLTLVALGGCAKSGDHTIVFRLPQGFSGPFVVVVDPTAANLPSDSSSVQMVNVPANGVVRVPSLSLFEYRPKTSIVFPDGSQFEEENGNKGFSDWPTFWAGDSSLVSQGPASVRLIWYYVRPTRVMPAVEEFQWLRQRGVIR